MELDDEIHEKITDYCAKGDKLAEKQEFKAAIEEYKKAKQLIPAPQSDWDATVWVDTAMGDAYFFLSDFTLAADCFQAAYNNEPTNPFILMRLGQCLFELDDLKRSEEYLLGAYMLEGEEIFEHDHPKYLDFLRSNIDL